MHKAHSHTEILLRLKGKTLIGMMELLAELAIFSHATPFLFEKMTGDSYGESATCQAFS